MTSSLRLVGVAILLAVAALSLVMLEGARRDVEIRHVEIDRTPVTLYRSETAEATDTLVVISHGFAGSRQMMSAIALTLARAGHVVAAFDYIGHGRHPGFLSADIDSLTGTTQDLVEQTAQIVAHLRDAIDRPALSLVGHSMATDIVIRVAERIGEVGAVVAISMYSTAVTEGHPDRLLVISGQWEARLREVALDAVAQIEDAEEGVTVQRGETARRAIAAPLVGHVGVLWSPTTLRETAAWLGTPATPVSTGVWILALLGAIVLVFWPLARLLPVRDDAPPLPARRAFLAATLSAPVAIGAGLVSFPVFGLAGFGPLALMLAAYGAVALLLLRPSLRAGWPDVPAGAALLVWGLAVFALTLDRYGAAFLPTGPRLPLMAALLPATLIFGFADRVLVQGRGLVSRILLRIPFLACLLAAMVLSPASLALVFTVAPVLVLFHLVFGTMTGWAATRVGPVGPGLASGVLLAWSIAASTPLFAA